MPLPLAALATTAAVGIAKNLAGKLAGADAEAGAAAKARKTATEFEAMFLEQSLDRVFADGGEEGPLGANGTGGDVYRSMLVKEYAGSIVKSGGVGIAGQVFQEMLKLQEGAHGGR